MNHSRSRTPVYVLLVLGIVVIVLIAGGVVAFRVWGPRQYVAATESMAPTIRKGDRFTTQKIKKSSDIRRGWIVEFDNPDTRQQPDAHTLFKRVVGLPGDQISAADGKLLINGQPADEPYLTNRVITADVAPVTVPTDSFYVLGDAREDSLDSRMWGPISAKLIHRHATEVRAPTNHRHKL
jgi:signal peptidase I